MYFANKNNWLSILVDPVSIGIERNVLHDLNRFFELHVVYDTLKDYERRADPRYDFDIENTSLKKKSCEKPKLGLLEKLLRLWFKLNIYFNLSFMLFLLNSLK